MDAIARSLNPVLPGIRQESADAVPHLRRLTAALVRGDDAAWAEFHRDYGPEIFRYALGGARGDYDLAAEALQHTYLRVARYARPCDSVEEFRGWLRTLASSALNDCRRRRKSFWSRFLPAGSSESAVPPTANDEERIFAALDLALAQLSAKEQALLEQKYFSGTDVRSLAVQLEISPKALESRLTRARAELRRQLSVILSRDE